jgi:chromosomal replication initiator protein
MPSAWNQVKTQIHKQIPHHSFMVWIEPLEWMGLQDNEVLLGCPSAFAKKWVNNHYAELIQSELQKVCEGPRHIVLKILNGDNGNGDNGNGEKPPVENQLPLPYVTRWKNGPHPLGRDLTFDHFVVGASNDFAYKAALDLASDGDRYRNTLFLLSPTGLGKSHLSQAAGNHILTQNSRVRVCYVTAEDFTNAMVYALRHGTIEQFKEKYRRQCDVLLLEDVQFLSGKEKTQHELGYTLDALLGAEKKLIFTSTHLPDQIPKMDGKLVSRLSSGIISTIEKPDFETRVRIAKKKGELRSIDIPGDVAEYLAGELTDNIRQLESGVIGIGAKASLLRLPINIKLAEEVVRNIASQSKKITVRSIQKLVCKHYKLTTEELLSRSRKRSIVQPRQIAMYLARRYTDKSLQTIGRSFNRYHATTLHAVGAVERHIKEKGAVQKQVEFLSGKLESGDL